MFLRRILLSLITVMLAACNTAGQPQGSISEVQPASQNWPTSTIVVNPTETAAAVFTSTAVPQIPTATTAPENTPTTEPPATPTEAAAIEPTSSSAGVLNPLTGLPVQDSDYLALPPALVSITNFPVTARPQAGLSFSPFVFEMYIGSGMTRYLALFYGDYPQAVAQDGVAVSDDRVGPIRSGRLPYNSLRKLYNGFLVMASASSSVLPSLGNYTNVWGSDSANINSAMIPVARLEEISTNNPTRLKEGALSGLNFDSQAPQGGQLGTKVWIPFSFLNQVIWQYDAASGAYHRYQDQADGETFVQATDRLNGDPLAYENVVVLFATHRSSSETVIDIDLMYINKMPALLFRDGQMYEVFWSTANEDFEKQTGLVRPIRFFDAEGNPFPLKPGQTWVEIMQPFTRYNETVDSEVYFDLKRKSDPGSGVWAVHFYAPQID